MGRVQHLLLAIIQTDRTFERVSWRGKTVWSGKCIHCNTRLQLEENGRPISRATVEHILPRNHGGTDDLENLAIACARCNHGKGARHDTQPLTDPKLAAMIERLRQRRRKRWRDSAERTPGGER